MADQPLRLRPAKMEDAERLLAWRNDPEARRQSKSEAEVPLADHQAWLRRVLADPEMHLRIAMEGNLAVGSVRADRRGGHWLLSWTVAPEARGQNAGFRMVGAMIRELAAPVRAEIKPGNPASLRMAEKLGMRRVADEDGMTVWALDP